MLKNEIDTKNIKPCAYLANGWPIYDLLNPHTSLSSKKDKYRDNPNVYGFRLHGLLGDSIKFCSLIPSFLDKNPQTQFVLLITNTESNRPNLALQRSGLYLDLYKNLIDKQIITDIFFSTFDIQGRMSIEYELFFKYLGISNMEDYSYPTFKLSDKLIKEKAILPSFPYLGFDAGNLSHQPKKVALFRYSGFHTHFLRRNIPEEGWLKIEETLQTDGWELHLYGYDDIMRTAIPPGRDYRKKFSILETLSHAQDASLCVATTTFLSLYLHFFIPCFVIADPNDVLNIKNIWRINTNYNVVSSQVNYIEELKLFLRRIKNNNG